MSKNPEAGSTGENRPGIGGLKKLGLVTVAAASGILGGCSAGAEGPCQQPPATTAEAGPSSDNRLSPKEYERVNDLVAAQLSKRAKYMNELLTNTNMPYGEDIFKTVWQDPKNPESYTDVVRVGGSLSIINYDEGPTRVDGVTRKSRQETRFEMIPLVNGAEVRYTNEKSGYCEDQKGNSVDCPNGVIQWKEEVDLVNPTHEETYPGGLTPTIVEALLDDSSTQIRRIARTSELGETYTHAAAAVDDKGNIDTEGDASNTESPKDLIAGLISRI